MLTFLSNLALSALISASTWTNPTTPKANAFGASAFVTIDNQVRVSVIKGADAPAEIVLRNANNLVIFRQSLNRKDEKCALKLNVNELTDGKYELEVKSGGSSIKKELNLSTQTVHQNSRVVAMQ